MVGEHHTELLRRNVQAAAAASAVPVDAAQHFGHQAAGIGTAGDQVRRAAVIRENAVARLQCADHADGAGFLADTGAGAGGAAALEFDELLFIGTDQQHGFQPAESVGHSGRAHWATCTGRFFGVRSR